MVLIYLVPPEERGTPEHSFNAIRPRQDGAPRLRALKP